MPLSPTINSQIGGGVPTNTARNVRKVLLLARACYSEHRLERLLQRILRSAVTFMLCAASASIAPHLSLEIAPCHLLGYSRSGGLLRNASTLAIYFKGCAARNSYAGCYQSFIGASISNGIGTSPRGAAESLKSSCQSRTLLDFSSDRNRDHH